MFPNSHCEAGCRDLGRGWRPFQSTTILYKSRASCFGCWTRREGRARHAAPRRPSIGSSPRTGAEELKEAGAITPRAPHVASRAPVTSGTQCTSPVAFANPGPSPSTPTLTPALGQAAAEEMLLPLGESPRGAQLDTGSVWLLPRHNPINPAQAPSSSAEAHSPAGYSQGAALRSPRVSVLNADRSLVAIKSLATKRVPMPARATAGRFFPTDASNGSGARRE